MTNWVELPHFRHAEERRSRVSKRAPAARIFKASY